MRGHNKDKMSEPVVKSTIRLLGRNRLEVLMNMNRNLVRRVPTPDPAHNYLTATTALQESKA